MIVTSLGHAGFMIEAGSDKILADPWMNPAGAYGASWFPYPSNGSIIPEDLEQATILYVSHWHRDHLDEWYLGGRSERFKKNVRVLIPKFKYKKLLQVLRECGYQRIEELVSFDRIVTESGADLAVIFDANPLFVDSALLVRSDGVTFLNANDCKLPVNFEVSIVKEFGTIDIFAAQFSGATFHPTCYDYDARVKTEISTARRGAKFERIVSSIKRLGASYCIPSAGPACFLSEDLFHLNMNPETVFATSADFHDFLIVSHPEIIPTYTELLPTESLTVTEDQECHITKRTNNDFTLTQEYIRKYSTKRAALIATEIEKYRLPVGDILADSKRHFLALYNNVPELAHLAGADLELCLLGEVAEHFFLNLSTGKVSDFPFENQQQKYRITLDAFWMRAIINKLLTWEDFILSFRFEINRQPDIYNEALIAFLHLETEEERRDYITYHESIASDAKERIFRTVGNSVIEHDRYCPHNGEDLSCAVIEDGILTCPRHFWKFSIKDGIGINNPATINIVRKEEPSS